MTRLKVTKLRCDSCLGRLQGLNTDSVFTCLDCRVGIAIEGGEKKTYPLKIAKRNIESSSGSTLYLPFWELVGEIARKEAIKETLGREIVEIDNVFLPGFSTRKQQLFGDISLIYTETGTKFEEDEKDQPAGVVGIARGTEDADRHGDAIAKIIIDKRKDITGLDVRFAVRERVIWMIPFEEREGMIVDGIKNRAFPKQWVEDIREIERFNKKKD